MRGRGGTREFMMGTSCRAGIGVEGGGWEVRDEVIVEISTYGCVRMDGMWWT